MEKVINDAWFLVSLQHPHHCLPKTYQPPHPEQAPRSQLHQVSFSFFGAGMVTAISSGPGPQPALDVSGAIETQAWKCLHWVFLPWRFTMQTYFKVSFSGFTKRFTFSTPFSYVSFCWMRVTFTCEMKEKENLNIKSLCLIGLSLH